jgi:hypothetical protein
MPRFRAFSLILKEQGDADYRSDNGTVIKSIRGEQRIGFGDQGMEIIPLSTASEIESFVSLLYTKQPVRGILVWGLRRAGTTTVARSQ